MISNNIKEYRKKFNITQEELGQELGYTKQYISRIENNKVNISVATALLIVECFQNITFKKGQQVILTVDDLFYIN